MRKSKKLSSVIARVYDHQRDLVDREANRRGMDKSSVLRAAIDNLDEPSFLEALCLDAVNLNCSSRDGYAAIDWRVYLYRRQGLNPSLTPGAVYYTKPFDA